MRSYPARVRDTALEIEAEWTVRLKQAYGPTPEWYVY